MSPFAEPIESVKRDSRGRRRHSGQRGGDAGLGLLQAGQELARFLFLRQERSQRRSIDKHQGFS